jgi:hypothetical protein
LIDALGKPAIVSPVPRLRRPSRLPATSPVHLSRAPHSPNRACPHRAFGVEGWTPLIAAACVAPTEKVGLQFLSPGGGGGSVQILYRNIKILVRDEIFDPQTHPWRKGAPVRIH